MATSKISILIEADDKASAKLRAIAGGFDDMNKKGKAAAKEGGLLWTEFNSAIMLAERGVRMAKAAFDQTVGAVMNYNKSILDSARASGTSVEQFSRIVQVADDVGISMGDVQTALQLATKNGFAPSVNSLADLADELNAMESPTARAASAAKIFGRNWAALDPLLQTGGKAIRENASAIADGLVVTMNEVRKTEELRIKIDALNDSYTATKNIIGLELVPMLLEDIDTVNKAAGAYSQLNDVVQYYLATNKETTRIVMESRLAHAEAAGAFENYGSEAHGATEAIEKLKDASLEELKIAEAQAYLDGDTTKLDILRAEIALREGNNIEIQNTIRFLEHIRNAYAGQTWHVNVDVTTPEGFGITSGGPQPGGGTGSGNHTVVDANGVTWYVNDKGWSTEGYKAAGGPVMGGQPYVVGEEGPEVFVPKQSGDIINNTDSRQFIFNSSGARGDDDLLEKFQQRARRS